MAIEPPKQVQRAAWRNPLFLLVILALVLALIVGWWFYVAWFILKLIYTIVHGIIELCSGQWLR